MPITALCIAFISRATPYTEQYNQTVGIHNQAPEECSSKNYDSLASILRLTYKLQINLVSEGKGKKI